MKILSNYNFTYNFNYLNSITQRSNNIQFRGSEPIDNDTFEHPKIAEEDIRNTRLNDMGIKEIIVDENKVYVENMNGDFSEAEIPETYFKDVEDRQSEVEGWILNGLYGNDKLGMPFELLDIMDKLGLQTDLDYKDELEIYRNSLANGIKIVSYNWENGDTNIEIDGRPYKFKIENMSSRVELCRDMASQDSELNQMIRNIKRAGTVKGIVENVGNKDIVISNLLDRVPDVKRDEMLVLNGNVETEEYDIYDYFDILEYYARKEINPNEIKTIEYLEKPFEGYDNNRVLKAYSYYNNKSDKLYLYIPEKNVVQVLNSTNFVKNHKV